MTTEIKEQIVKYSKELRLPTFRGEFEVHASEAAKQEASYEEYLLGLMEKEYYTRVENRKKSQIRQAGFPQKHYLHDLKKDMLPENAGKNFHCLKGLILSRKARTLFWQAIPVQVRPISQQGLG
jgi:DNA replication protein DnaC